jgi:hypothetical protein
MAPEIIALSAASHSNHFNQIEFLHSTGSDPSVTDYILEIPAKCPNCRREILEKKLIEPV